MTKMWKDIIHVTRDHSTIYMRIPMAWAKENKVKAGSYLICRQGADGELVVKTWDQEMADAKKADDGESGANR